MKKIIIIVVIIVTTLAIVFMNTLRNKQELGEHDAMAPYVDDQGTPASFGSFVPPLSD